MMQHHRSPRPRASVRFAVFDDEQPSKATPARSKLKSGRSAHATGDAERESEWRRTELLQDAGARRRRLRSLDWDADAFLDQHSGSPSKAAPPPTRSRTAAAPQSARDAAASANPPPPSPAVFFAAVETPARIATLGEHRVAARAVPPPPPLSGRAAEVAVTPETTEVAYPSDASSFFTGLMTGVAEDTDSLWQSTRSLVRNIITNPHLPLSVLEAALGGGDDAELLGGEDGRSRRHRRRVHKATHRLRLLRTAAAAPRGGRGRINCARRRTAGRHARHWRMATRRRPRARRGQARRAPNARIDARDERT